MVRKALKVSLGAGAQRRVGLRAAGHDDRTESRRLFPRQQHEAEDGDFATGDEAIKAYDSGRCDAYTTDSSGLYGERLKLAKPDDHIVLPEIISKEPLSPAVRQGDDQWCDIVRWAHFAMLNAEELGVTKTNVDEQLKSRQSGNPATARCRGQLRRGARPHQRLGLSDRQAGRQLRRDFRAQRRPGLAAENRARPQRAVDQGRPPVRAAGSLICSQVASPRRAARWQRTPKVRCS